MYPRLASEYEEMMRRGIRVRGASQSRAWLERLVKQIFPDGMSAGHVDILTPGLANGGKMRKSNYCLNCNPGE